MSQVVEIILIVSLFLLVLMSAFFSGAETAYSSVSRVKIEKAVDSGKKTGKLIKKHYKSFGWTLATILIANNLVNVSASAIMTYVFSSFFSNGFATILATFVMTPIIVLFGEIIPKLLAKKYSYGYLVKIVYLMEILNWIFFPLTFMLRKLAFNAKVTNSEDEIKTYLKIASSEGVLEKKEASLAANALDLDSKKVENVYTHLEDVKFLTTQNSLLEAKKMFKETGHSRLPIKDINNEFIGVILLKDIIFSNKKNITDFIHKISSVSKNMLITTVLEQIRISKTHIAFVTLNLKSKAIIGIITFEDIIEELVGEIYDEHDKNININEIALDKLRVGGNTLMKELAEELNFKFEDIEEKTVKQWITDRIKRSFKKNLKYTYKDKFRFHVISNKNKEESIIEVIKK